MEDIPILQRWQRVKSPTHEVRDAMLKLGLRWQVGRTMKSKHRSPEQVAKELEERMLDRAKELLTGSVAKPAVQSTAAPVDGSAPKIARKASPPRKPETLDGFFTRRKRTAEATIVTAPSPVSVQASLEHTFEAATRSTSQQSGNATSADKPAGSPEWGMDIQLTHLNELFADRSDETRVAKMLRDVATLRAWQSEKHPTNKVRDAMTKLSSDWDVPQKALGKKRVPAHIAQDLERKLLAAAQRLLEKSTPFNGKRNAPRLPLEGEQNKHRRNDQGTPGEHSYA